MNDPVPAVVPRGERDALARTAQETGERFGRMEAKIDTHADHFDRLNGSVGHLATSVAEQATAMAVMASSMKVIADNLAASGETQQREQGMSLQVKLVLLAGGITLLGAIFSAMVFVVMTVVVLWANGKL